MRADGVYPEDWLQWMRRFKDYCQEVLSSYKYQIPFGLSLTILLASTAKSFKKKAYQRVAWSGPAIPSLS
jgi:hypothetical protein